MRPDEQQWLRVEELAESLEAVVGVELAARLAGLEATGESPTVLTLLRGWLELPPPVAPLGPGATLAGRYQLIEKLGEGGMGSVWRARQDRISREVALKIVHPSLATPAFRASFVSEMTVLGKLNHPGIVRIYDADVVEQDGFAAIPFFTMELVEGQRLDRWAAAHRENLGELLRLMGAVCAAVQGAHDRHVVHRDLKPGNILVRPDGQPVVLDYGISRLAGVTVGEEGGLFSGTPAYAAPEQHLGQDLDFRSGQSADVYSLGVTLFEVLAGRRLFVAPAGAGVAAIRQAVLQGEPTRLSQVVPDCLRSVEDIVLRAVRRNPADRYHSVAALGRSLLRVAGELGPAPAPVRAWTPAPGKVIPGTEWRLEDKIGEGGVGEVWTGTHPGRGERQVFKFCDSEEKARTLRREFTLYRLLRERIGRNPHFIQLWEISLDEPPWYVQMESVAGRDLPAWCAAHPGGIAAIPLESRIEIVAQAAEALQVAHDAGILHRDIKPSNLLIGRGGPATTETVPSEAGTGPSTVHVWIADFGIGKNLHAEPEGKASRRFQHTLSDFSRNQPLGTLLYMAPEVQEGQPATARSDLYSLGVVLWQLLIGDLSVALDPTDWQSRISDPLLRTDLAGCLAGVPEKRWTSAGELAARLRSLPARRAEETQKAEAQSALEKAAYRRGIVRASAFAALVVALFAGLAWVAWHARGTARRAEGRGYIEQAGTLKKTDLGAGRRNKGFRWLELAAERDPTLYEFRNAAAAVTALADLVPAAAVPLPAGPAPLRFIPPLPDETNRTLSADGTVLAIARNLDGLNGAVEIVNLTDARRLVVERKQFPWVPIAEAGLFAFSPDHRYLAVGGAATSRQVLICETASGSVRSYIFHGSDPTVCAWYPGGGILATGCQDAGIRLWDLNAAKIPIAGASGSNTGFTLPPQLDLPALDIPMALLQGHRAAIRYLAFSADGRWLASLDTVGTLQIRTGFSPAEAGIEPRIPHDFDVSGTARSVPEVTVSLTLDRLDGIVGLAVVGQQVIVSRRSGPNECYRLVESSLPAEKAIGAPVTGIAWNGGGDQLGLNTLNSFYRLGTAPQGKLEMLAGVNPVGVAWAGGHWLYASGTSLLAVAPARNPGLQGPESISFPLLSAEERQGAQTGLAATANGRVAVYHGRRIQFYAGHALAPTNSSIVVRGGSGKFEEIQWDGPGKRLGIVVREPDSGRIRLESWITSTNFPPACQPLPLTELPGGRITPANDGRHFMGRNRGQGVFLFEPGVPGEQIVAGSAEARDISPLAVSDNGALLAMVIDRNHIRLMKIASGEMLAQLQSPHEATITALEWDRSSQRLVSVSEGGIVQIWDMAEWRDWLRRHGAGF